MKKSVCCALALSTVILITTGARAERALGIDVSSANGTIHWNKVAADGITFAFARATTGYNDGIDASFTNNMVKGKAAGLQMGAYEFSEMYADTPAQEANYFWSTAGPYILADGKSLNPCIDFEVFSGHDGASSYTAWLNAWAADVKAKTAVFMHPVVYVSACAGACDLTAPVSLSPFIGNINGEDPQTGTPWSDCLSCNAWGTSTNDWTFWLYATGAVTGITGNVDLDVYNGTLAELKSFEGVGE